MPNGNEASRYVSCLLVVLPQKYLLFDTAVLSFVSQVSIYSTLNLHSVYKSSSARNMTSKHKDREVARGSIQVYAKILINF